MIGRLWHRLRPWSAPSRQVAPSTPFIHEMRSYTAAGIWQIRASLRARREDQERTNFFADDLLSDGHAPLPERDTR